MNGIGLVLVVVVVLVENEGWIVGWKSEILRGNAVQILGPYDFLELGCLEC